MRITHDIHTHSTLSHCCYDPAASVANLVRRAAELGHTVFGISNHLWDERVPGASRWYKNQMISYGLEARNSVPADTCGVKVLIGVETEYFAAGDTLGMLAETANNLTMCGPALTHPCAAMSCPTAPTLLQLPDFQGRNSKGPARTEYGPSQAHVKRSGICRA